MDFPVTEQERVAVHVALAAVRDIAKAHSKTIVLTNYVMTSFLRPQPYSLGENVYIRHERDPFLKTAAILFAFDREEKAVLVLSPEVNHNWEAKGVSAVVFLYLAVNSDSYVYYRAMNRSPGSTPEPYFVNCSVD